MKRKNSFDVFVLFSGDSDFEYLLKELKKNKKECITISTKHHISKELIRSSDRYLDILKIKESIKRK